MEIHEASDSELTKIRDLYLSLLKSDPDSFVDEYNVLVSRTDTEWSADLKRDNGKIFVANDKGKLAGMGRINLYRELPNVPVLHKLGVLPEYRGKGIAKRLVEARENWAKAHGASKVRTYIISDNQKAIDFSKGNGYKIIETLKNNTQRKNGDFIDVLVLEKELSENTV